MPIEKMENETNFTTVQIGGPLDKTLYIPDLCFYQHSFLYIKNYLND